MGSVLFKGGGGGGTYSSDLSTKASDVVKGKSYVGSDTNDEIGTGTLDLSATANATAAQVLKDRKFFTNNSQLPNKPLVGTMANVAGLENAKTTRVANNNLILGMTNGAHITNSSGKSYPEVQTPYATVASNLGLTAAKLANGTTVAGVKGTYKGLGNAVASNVLAGKTFSTASLSNVAGTMPNRGLYQYAGGFGAATDDKGEYVAFNNMPVGYYGETSDTASWAPEVRMLKKDFLNYIGLTADKIAYGCSIMGIAGTNYGGQIIQSSSPFVNGKFGDGVSLDNFDVWSWGSNIGEYGGSDSRSIENGDHIHVTFKDYRTDSSMSGNSGAILAFNKLISFAPIKTITMKFSPVFNTNNTFGYSITWSPWVFYFQAGTTNGGSQLGHDYTSLSPRANVYKEGTMITATWDVSNITVNGYFSINFNGNSWSGRDSDSYNWHWIPFMNIYSITFS